MTLVLTFFFGGEYQLGFMSLAMHDLFLMIWIPWDAITLRPTSILMSSLAWDTPNLCTHFFCFSLSFNRFVQSISMMLSSIYGSDLLHRIDLCTICGTKCSFLFTNTWNQFLPGAPYNSCWQFSSILQTRYMVQQFQGTEFLMQHSRGPPCNLFTIKSLQYQHTSSRGAARQCHVITLMQMAVI